jgi:hypothetical protein
MPQIQHTLVWVLNINVGEFLDHQQEQELLLLPLRFGVVAVVELVLVVV